MIPQYLACAITLMGVLNGPGQASATTFQVSSPVYHVTEDAGMALITVLRTGDAAGIQAVDYATGDGTAKAGADYVAKSGTVRFAAGETSQTFTVPILDDGLVEDDETVNEVASISRTVRKGDRVP